MESGGSSTNEVSRCGFHHLQIAKRVRGWHTLDALCMEAAAACLSYAMDINNINLLLHDLSKKQITYLHTISSHMKLPVLVTAQMQELLYVHDPFK